MKAHAGNGVTVQYAKGASYEFGDEGKTDGFAEALALAKSSDVVVAVMGEKWDMTGEVTRAYVDQ